MNAATDIAGARPFERSLLAVPGMRCAACISKIERGLRDVPGIISSRVNFTARQVEIAHEPGINPPALKAAMASIGFDAEPIAEEIGPTGDKESRRLLRATAVAGFASMNIMLLSVSVWSGATGGTRDLFHLLSGAIAIPTVAYSGRPFFASAWNALRHRRTNMDVPISIGVLLVTALSLFETLTHGPHAYFDGAVMLLFFLLVGRLLDGIMRDRARSGVAALLKQSAPGALVCPDGGATQWLTADKLQPGMTMIVPAGERFAADGRVVEGESGIDLSLLTGESAPRLVAPGGQVHAGTLNLHAPLTVRVTAAGSRTALADIARLMEQAGQGKSRYVRIADRAARWYAPAVHTLALASFAGWMLAGAGWHMALLIAAAVLIITCPCALGLAVPAAQIVAAGTLMRRGVLVKDGSALERLAEVDRALFDKTGTLTVGRPTPVDIDRLDARQRSVALGLARASSHPLSAALRRELEAEAVLPAKIDQLIEQAGFGMRGTWQGITVALGRAVEHRGEALLDTTLSIGTERPQLIQFHDPLRPQAAEVFNELDLLGIPPSIISGDRAAAVAPIARTVKALAQTAMRPGDKLATIERLSTAGQKVLMVGDGLNDGPALAAAHASLAPGSASDVGQNAADAVFLGDSLGPVAVTVKVARRTMAVVRQNFVMAIIYNALAVPLALAGMVTPLVAALAMSSSSIIVVANALRLKWAAQ
ncbi:MAG: heavy metal translocating P-type ATPase [Sphingomonas sp.]